MAGISNNVGTRDVVKSGVRKAPTGRNVTPAMPTGRNITPEYYLDCIKTLVSLNAEWNNKLRNVGSLTEKKASSCAARRKNVFSFYIRSVTAVHVQKYTMPNKDRIFHPHNVAEHQHE